MTVCLMLLSSVIYISYGAIGEYAVIAAGEGLLIIPVVIGVLYLKKHGIAVKDALALKGFSPCILPGASLAISGAQFFIIFATFLFQYLITLILGAPPDPGISAPENAAEFIWAFFAVCVAAPVFEEMLFRGVIVKLFEGYKTGVVIIASSAAFALLHFDLRSFTVLFFVGMVLCVFRLGTGSVFLGIILHSLNNFISLIETTFPAGPVYYAVSAFSMISAVIFPFVIYRLISDRKYGFKDYRPPAGQAVKPGVSAGMIICIVLFLVYNAALFIADKGIADKFI